jgi:two-component system, OmpR family, sensor histidine kinase TctE
VRLAVGDEGAGIAASLREKVFEPFFRASALPGSGLGLAIVREIARAHRATLRLDDGAGGRGLLVTAVFPVG